ncbi:MAG: tyrosine-type recombinase/integrase [ANME-2 cluster archaeon]|nr:tyrosine-type recombinase/integrase [ANME-2 cluster archaeon]
MIAAISVSDFDHHREDYHNLRLGIFNHQPSGVKGNEYDLNLFSDYFHGHNINAITGEEILNSLAWLREERGNHAGAINRKEASIRSYFRYLRFVQIEGADSFPIESMPRAREPYTGPVKALEPDEVSRLLGSIDKNSVLGFRDFFLYSMLYRLGLRIGEAISININDIDFEKQILNIHGKGRRERKLPLLPDLMDILEKWLVCRTRLYGANQLDALFISKKGNRLSIRTAQDNFQKIVTKAGPFSINKVTPHSMRHAFATHAIEGEQDIFVLKAILGHASTKSTEIYLHPSMRVLRKAVNNHVASEILADLITTKNAALRVHQRT